MGNLEKLTPAQLNSALTAHGAPSPESPSKEDSSRLLILLDETARRYPSQDQEQSITEYFRDFEALVMKYSLQRVRQAVESRRIKPGRAFFPRPDEVAEEIEHLREKQLQAAKTRDGDAYNSKFNQWRDAYNSPEEIAWRKVKGFTK